MKGISFDWKFVLAVGGSAVGIVLAYRMEPAAIKRVLIHAIDACKCTPRAIEGTC